VLYNPDAALQMMFDAMNGNKKVEKWKKRFIGKPFDGNLFAEKVEKYIKKHKENFYDNRRGW